MDFILEKQTEEDKNKIRQSRVEYIKYNIRLFKEKEKELQQEFIRVNMKSIINNTRLKAANLELEILEMEGKGYDN
jgi:hypothetical protein